MGPKITFIGTPWKYRYSDIKPPKHIVKEMQKIDSLLDLKFYLPKEQWHVVRYPHGRSGEFVRVWAVEESPDRGLHGYLGMWIVDALKAGDMRKRDLIKEVDDNNASIEASNARELEENSKDFAKDYGKALNQWHDYGPNSETHFVY